MFEVVAFQITGTLDIRQCKNTLSLKVLFSSSDELYLRNGLQKFVYIFQYGMVSFFNHNDSEIQDILEKLAPVTKQSSTAQLSEKIKVEIIEGQRKVTFNKVILPNFNQEAIRMVMLNTSQSVALDRYAAITELLLEETNEHTKYLEKYGQLDIEGNKLKRFIGRILNIKNQISENLYIFDEPDATWENENLNKLNQELKQTFDLKNRYRLIYQRIEIIKENLSLFKDIMEHSESSRLEWIIIILILVEVIDLFVLRIFKL